MKLVLLEQMALLSLIVYCLIDTAMCDCFLCIVVFFSSPMMAICCIYLLLEGNLTLTRKFSVLETQLGLAYPKSIPSVLFLKVCVVLGLILNTPFPLSMF